MPDLDPTLPVVGEDGLEYETLGHCICGIPIKCYRNDQIAGLDKASVGEVSWRQWVWGSYQSRNRRGDLYSALKSERDGTVRDRRVFPQGLEFFSPSRPEGDGSPGAVKAPADPIHTAD